MFVYSPPYKQIIASFYEDLQITPGIIKGNFTTFASGIYYIAIFPEKTSEIKFTIEIERVKRLQTPETLVWTKNDSNLYLRSGVKKGDGKMECPNCQFDNREEAAFCLECGTELGVICPGCEKALPPRAKFCDTCGRDLRPPRKTEPQIQEPTPAKDTPPPKPIESERKHVTALFSDLPATPP